MYVLYIYIYIYIWPCAAPWLYIFVDVENGTDLNYVRDRLPLAFCPLISGQFLHRLPLSFCIVCRFFVST